MHKRGNILKRVLRFVTLGVIAIAVVGALRLPVFAVDEPSNEPNPATISTCQFPQNTEALLSYAAEDAVWPELANAPLQLNNQIPAGAYKISAHSYDNHTGKNDPTQNDERWQFWAYGADTASPMYYSGYTADIPDNQDTNTTEFAYVYFNQPVSYLRYAHYAYANGLENLQFGGRSFDDLTPSEKALVTWQSVIPSCIDFEPILPITCQGINAELSAKDAPKTYDINAQITNPQQLNLKVKFTFGDGTQQIVDDTTVNHTYATNGQFTVTAVMTFQDIVVATCSGVLDVGTGRISNGGAVLGDSATASGTPTSNTVAAHGSVLGASTTADMAGK